MKRSEVQEKYKWHLTDLVESDEAFEKSFTEVLSLLDGFKQYEGKLGEKESALACLKLGSKVDCLVETLYVYAHMRMHGDMSESVAVGYANRTEALAAKVMTAESFISSELGALSEKIIDSYIADPEFSDYSFSLSEIKRQKAHILSEKEERLLAMSAEALSATDNISSMLMNADLKFKPIKKDGKNVELTNESYGALVSDEDRKVRKAAFNNLYDGYIAHINTLTASYAGNVKSDNFHAVARGYKDCLEMAMESEGVPTAVYENLIAAVERNLEPLHRYIALRKKMLGLKELHMYDLHVPVVENAQMKLSYEEACEMVKSALAPMGKEYVALLDKSMKEGWIDVMPNDGKRGGAYSWGAYGTHPYVLLNYAPTTSDIFTIAHELGHCMHTYYSNTTQPFDKAGYRIFVAEVASTCNETLLEKYLMDTVKDKNIQRYLLSYRLDRFRTTLFRQAMFAEFEYEAHKMDLEGKPLTVDALNGLYYDLNKKYYGPSVVSDDKIAYEWSRIPHFYNAFYVYKYSTGITAATSIAHNILTRGDYVDIYKNKFLCAGGSKKPYEILCDAEVDLATDKPYDDAFAFFAEALDKLESM
ncbi:MAG: oligoendopeptidase F [Clostridiales bacterium]|nr:oligoendopeptidase F [Clostridiales bacterium]